ncbi:MAG: hypothetical protein WEB03_07740 [Nitriliruptor sp.]|uniref:hypothetical protein n=1 Tax=Nitriliruptor sp. TaxID=2448056 RepID=UPI0034A07F01
MLLLGGGLGLVAGMWTGLSRAGFAVGTGPAAHHGVLMTLGFLGTLVALERAVAYRAGWAYLAPASSGAAVVWLLAGGPVAGSGLLFGVAGTLVVVVYVRTWVIHREPYLVLMGLGGVASVVAALLWSVGVSPIRLAPTLAGFVVLTIVGERLELSRLRRPSRGATRRLLVAVATFVAGVVLSWSLNGAGLIVGGVGLLATTAWFARNDVARVTIRLPGLPRFAAVCMLAGYLWLAVGGALWIALGTRGGGALIFDAAVHAVFLGFVLSMVMGHAPIILPAVLRVVLPYRPVVWLPLVLLHLTVGVRVAADLAGSTWVRGVSAAGNVAALVSFIVVTIALGYRERDPSPRATARHRSRTPMEGGITL